MTTWLVKKDGRMFGPFDVEQIRRLIESGKIDEDTLVRDGNSGPWELVSRVRGLLNDDDGASVADPFTPKMLQAREPATEPATQPVAEPAKQPATEPAIEASETFSNAGVEAAAGGLAMHDDEVAKVDSNSTGTGEIPASNPRVWKPATQTECSAEEPPKKSDRVNSGSPAAGRGSLGKVSDSQLGGSENTGASPVVTGMLSLIPGAGHVFLGMQQIGFVLMAVIPTLYVLLWGCGVGLARICINADGTVATDQSFAGRLIAEQTGSTVGMSILAATVIVCLVLPLAVHVAAAVHAVQSAE